MFLFIFGAVSQGVNEMGVFNAAMPVPNGTQVQYSNVKDLNTGAINTDLNPWNTVMIFLSFIKVIGAGVIAIFFVAPFIYNMFVLVGVDGTWAAIVATMLQAPLTMVLLFGLYEWWTGRSVT
jgi:hypothetical protein